MKPLSVLTLALLVCGGCESQSAPPLAPVAATPTIAEESSNEPADPAAAIETPPPDAAAPPAAVAEKPAADKPAAEEAGWVSLFDGRSLAGWKSTEFGGEGEVKVEDGAIVMEMGQDMTGITWAGKEPPPKTNYELSLEGQRVDGSDFFCGLTFPVGDSHCSFIVGGWGGGVVGLSSINGFDASENDTTQYMEFKMGQWYKIRVRVTPERIQAFIDDKEVVDQDIEDRQVSIRGEVELSKPLGVSTWCTKGALRNIRLRKLPAEAADTKKAE